MNEPRHRWLGNVPIASLVELRRANENELFRRRIEGAATALRDCTIDDVDRVAAEDAGT